jgi:hypothetical protein
MRDVSEPANIELGVSRLLLLRGIGECHGIRDIRSIKT